MGTMIDDVRSSVHNLNIQEIIDAGVSSGSALFQGQNQYQTPDWLAKACISLLPRGHVHYSTVLDPQGASGNLLASFPQYVSKIAIDIDNREDCHAGVTRYTGNCVRYFEIMDDLFKDSKISCIVANPPFGLRWKTNEDTSIDSTEWTWNLILKRLAENGTGFLISNINTLRKLGITEHPWVYCVQEMDGAQIWGANVQIGIVHFMHTKTNVFHRIRLQKTWADARECKSCADILSTVTRNILNNTGWPKYDRDSAHHLSIVSDVIKEERSNRPKFNIYIDPRSGLLRTYLSTIDNHKLMKSDITRLSTINNCHPLTLTTEKETRELLRKIIEAGVYNIQPEAKSAIEVALQEIKSQACPILPVTDFELVAYTDEEETLTAKQNAEHGIILTPGKKYPIKTGTFTFADKFIRKKLHYDESGGTSLEDHDCTLTGEDRYIELYDDAGRLHRFMDRPNKNIPWNHSEDKLWNLFERPSIQTVAESYKEVYENNKSLLRLHSMMSGFEYFNGQLEYISRVGCKDYALIGADVGTGKTCMALALHVMKSPRRTLIMAPQGTMRSVGEEDSIDYQASQWVTEIQRFAPGEPVFQLFSISDYRDILHANGGEFPQGIYITYPQAYWQNNAFEFIPTTWSKVEEKFCKRFSLTYDKERPAGEFFSKSVGKSSNGIRCIAAPSLSTIINTEQGEWDMVIIDEAHLCCNINANVTKNLLRLQPKYRFAMTATPIPNYVSNLFSLMGWLCVPDWYKDNIRNVAWPYSVKEIGRFESTFTSTEIDNTEQIRARVSGAKNWKSTGVRKSPIISAPARLLKLLKPTLAYISKEDCNPNLVPCDVVDVRVPIGVEQGRLYAHWMNRSNYLDEFKNPLTIALTQMTRLRGVCASPASVDYNYKKVFDPEKGEYQRVPICYSDFNPKVIAALEIIAERIKRGEQVVVVAARVEQNNLLARRLAAAGIPISRIDSTIKAELHTAEANRFKRGDAKVMLMGIKCAQGHSFDQCPNLIIMSLEWSYGSLHQAKGRVWRLTSKRMVRVWCILHKNTIEELLFDKVAMKQDVATICLRGQRVPRDYMPLDASEVLAEHIVDYQEASTKSESECESMWPDIRLALAA